MGHLCSYIAFAKEIKVKETLDEEEVELERQLHIGLEEQARLHDEIALDENNNAVGYLLSSSLHA